MNSFTGRLKPKKEDYENNNTYDNTIPEPYTHHRQCRRVTALRSINHNILCLVRSICYMQHIHRRARQRTHTRQQQTIQKGCKIEEPIENITKIIRNRRLRIIFFCITSTHFTQHTINCVVAFPSMPKCEK